MYESWYLREAVTERHDDPVNLPTQPALLRERLYPRSARTVRSARDFAAETVAAWGSPGRRDDLLLCVSELATNALRHGVPRGRGYLLRLLRFGDCVRVEVHDSGPGLSRILDRATPGRGLLLVEACSDRWGAVPRSPGKSVWCEFEV